MQLKLSNSKTQILNTEYNASAAPTESKALYNRPLIDTKPFNRQSSKKNTPDPAISNVRLNLVQYKYTILSFRSGLHPQNPGWFTSK